MQSSQDLGWKSKSEDIRFLVVLGSHAHDYVGTVGLCCGAYVKFGSPPPPPPDDHSGCPSEAPQQAHWIRHGNGGVGR